jgi:VIT1/CCC1 family predicted Fe2+/Mn2+ transporter
LETNHNVPIQDQANGLAVTSMVLGIVGLVLVLVPFLPYPLGILAIIFGLISMKSPFKKGFAVTGLITGIVTILLKVLFWIGFASLFGI